MPTFRYSAYTAGGRETSGTIEAESLKEAKLHLKRDGLYPRDIGPVSETAGTVSRRFGGRNAGPAQVALMTRRLATLVGSQVPIYEAVTTLWEQEEPGEIKKALGRIRERLAEGANLAKALSLEPRLFSESYVAMVAAGEASGALDAVLERVALFLEEQRAIRSKITASLAYPTLMVLVGSAVMLFLLAFVIPKIVTIFEDNRAALPLITIALIKTSTFLRSFWWACIAAVAGVVLLYRRLMKDDAFRLRRDRFLLRIPVVGSLLRQLILSRFAKVLGLLLSSGVPVMRALEITAQVVVNRHYRAALTGVTAGLAEGGTLSGALRTTGLFPPLLVHMVAVGEKGGELEEMLGKAGSAFEREFESSVSGLMALLEPLLVLAMGLAVGLVVVAVLLPIFELNQLIR
ncbi:type II secretion system inner membrane protein GspF [Geobacter sulfurreducens]|uniref:General secretion pathway protein F n=1 Tax=Geobacter sulfurreducens (strain ATCC 51573 / DSM 12127 / PCA) TaxID=243231 RepID=Q74GB9_GEOSL|nr:type II secretion system inner membrane protein GspF [Geobacter sulfurreducens]AAR33660.1 type II secretion system inner membrane protein GspF [Geobacter sulfurreducens PCA]UAC04410.1 type II secretion system inner membrane protein GspF [Geobacter sulfurreducens]UTG93026.1 type II secretion system inner membrane protein GspF [Geobacter sulfurreducens]HBB69378.1 type II secretion system protein GspF [Geobacter sulfurreducens]HCD95876.1 type II secretion system protein GspF [Geobacter sulfurr